VYFIPNASLASSPFRVVLNFGRINGDPLEFAFEVM
jgi:hypothetical protein